LPLILVGNGEIADKLSILEIKSRALTGKDQLQNINNEISIIRDAWRRVDPENALRDLVDDLRRVNAELWGIEDSLREMEAAQCFDDRFIELARSVYKKNDLRAALKRKINVSTFSELVEEKCHPHYDTDQSL